MNETLQRRPINDGDERLLPSEPLLSPEEEEERLYAESQLPEYKFNPMAFPVYKAMRLQELMRRRSRVVPPSQVPMERMTPRPGNGFEGSNKDNNHA